MFVGVTFLVLELQSGKKPRKVTSCYRESCNAALCLTPYLSIELIIKSQDTVAIHVNEVRFSTK